MIVWAQIIITLMVFGCPIFSVVLGWSNISFRFFYWMSHLRNTDISSQNFGINYFGTLDTNKCLQQWSKSWIKKNKLKTIGEVCSIFIFLCPASSLCLYWSWWWQPCVHCVGPCLLSPCKVEQTLFSLSAFYDFNSLINVWLAMIFLILNNIHVCF